MQDLHQHLALTLREIRRQRGLSLDRTAAATGVSKAMLGQIERGESSPTIATLWKIASGLDVSLSGFLAAPPQHLQETLMRSADTLRQKPASDDMLIATLFPYEPSLGFEVFELTLLPGYERLSEPHAEGVVEHLMVIAGAMEAFVDGQWQTLKTGEALRFAADKPHGYRNLTGEPCVFHDLIAYAASTKQ